jgi:urease accessory protein
MTEGRVEVVLARDTGARTYLRRQFANYPFHLCRPHVAAGDPAGMITLYVQSISGGVYEGDRLRASLVAEDGARAHVTSQASTVVRGMERDGAAFEVEIEAGPESLVEYVPDATILFPGARLAATVRVRAHESATVIVGDSFLGHDPTGDGRPFDWYASDLLLEAGDGTARVRDRFVLSGRDFAAGEPGIGGAYATQGTLYVFHAGGGTESVVEALRDALAGDGIYAGASTLPNGAGAWARILAADGAALKGAMTAAWSAAREALYGSRPSPRRK